LRAVAIANGWPVLRVVASDARRRPSLRRLIGYD
jgi:hypothetical protein